MRTPLQIEEARERIRANTARYEIPRLRHDGDNEMSISICGYGPSLLDTWSLVKDSDRIMTTSGAHDFLIEKGIVPDFHVECDPREYKCDLLQKPNGKTVYLINSRCHPRFFEKLKDFNIVMWHGFTDDDIRKQIDIVNELEPDARLIAGGTNVGMRAIAVARELGFRNYDLHGFDCCYYEKKQWAGDHLGQSHRTVKVEVSGKVFETSDLMMISTDDFFKLLKQLPGCRFRIHGDGLLEERLKIFNRDPELALSPLWWKPIGFVRNRFWHTSFLPPYFIK